MPDLEMFRGNDRTFTLTVARDGRAVDLTGATLRWKARKSVKDLDADAVINKATGNGITITDPPNGIVDLTLLSADTKSLPAPLALIYEFEVTEASGAVSTPTIGVLLLKRTMVPV
jgi:hypothetical protein